jgi:hypothetical protein
MKEFYTFAEISNLQNRLDSLDPNSDFVKEKKEMIRKLVVDMQDEKTAFAFVRYHLHGEGDGKQKLYVKK